jgi:hypothetical protein
MRLGSSFWRKRVWGAPASAPFSYCAGRAREAGALLLALLRELGDENAYQRHLAARGCPASAEEWRRFSAARFAARFERPKCC